MTPAFVTLTGADSMALIPGMQALAATDGRIEWGILYGLSAPRFADFPTLEAFRRAGLRLSLHLCGPMAEAVFAGQSPDLNLSGFSRLQVNKPEGHASPSEIENALRFGRANGLRTILQCPGPFPDDPRADWLLDRSHGRGRPIATPPPLRGRAFCGYSGGLSPETVQGFLTLLPPTDLPFWIDAETSLRDPTEFSLDRCAAFTRLALTEPTAAISLADTASPSP